MVVCNLYSCNRIVHISYKMLYTILLKPVSYLCWISTLQVSFFSFRCYLDCENLLFQIIWVIIFFNYHRVRHLSTHKLKCIDFLHTAKIAGLYHVIIKSIYHVISTVFILQTNIIHCHIFVLHKYWLYLNIYTIFTSVIFYTRYTGQISIPSIVIPFLKIISKMYNNCICGVLNNDFLFKIILFNSFDMFVPISSCL